MSKHIQKFPKVSRVSLVIVFIILAFVICMAILINYLFTAVKIDQCESIEKSLVEKQYGHIHTKDIIKSYKKINSYCYTYTGYLESGVNNAKKLEVYYNLSFRAGAYKEEDTSKLFAAKAIAAYRQLGNNQQNDYKPMYESLNKLKNGTYWE